MSHPDSGHQHGPTARPDVVSAHTSKTSNKQEDARQQQERGFARDLLRQCRERAKVEQQGGGDHNQGGADQSAISFDVFITSVTAETSCSSCARMDREIGTI
ncbi:MAG: hypothetical protein JWM63_3889 [Gammaproteobacteria bacterium]|jgi:hypothetical protein|nr:hypothetical protein [Gammaproteobacteria bacterium]